MNWLYVGIPLLTFYVVWIVFLIRKKRYNRSLLIVAFAHLPFLLINLVAPFRGILDPNYAGYTFGWIQIPAGFWVTIIVGGIVMSSFAILTYSLLNRMNKLWWFALGVDMVLFTLGILPNLLEIFKDPLSMEIKLGEYLIIPSYLTIMIILLFFVLPMAYSITYSAKMVWLRSQKTDVLDSEK